MRTTPHARHPLPTSRRCDSAAVPDAPLTYTDWLDATGKDESFVGGAGVPGTAEEYERYAALLGVDPIWE